MGNQSSSELRAVQKRDRARGRSFMKMGKKKFSSATIEAFPSLNYSTDDELDETKYERFGKFSHYNIS